MGRGEKYKDNRNRNIATTLTVHSDGIDYVSECVQTVHCAGDCADRQHITTPELKGGGAHIAKTYDNSCRKRETKTNLKHTIPSQKYVCAAENNDKTLSDKNILVNNILRRTIEQSQTSNTSSSKLSDRGDRHDHITESYEGDILPNFDIWMKEMMGNIQNEGAGDDSLLGGEGDGHESVRRWSTSPRR